MSEALWEAYDVRHTLSGRMCDHVLWLRCQRDESRQYESRLPSLDGCRVRLQAGLGSYRRASESVVWRVCSGYGISSKFAAFLSHFLGAIFVGHYADRIGRLKTVEIGCIWGLLGAALQASAQNFTWMAFARIIGGVGCGHLNTIVPIWTSELADPNLRGAFVAVEFTLALAGSTM